VRSLVSAKFIDFPAKPRNSGLVSGFPAYTHKNVSCFLRQDEKDEQDGFPLAHQPPLRCGAPLLPSHSVNSDYSDRMNRIFRIGDEQQRNEDTKVLQGFQFAASAFGGQVAENESALSWFQYNTKSGLGL
jgi:hypothetical protein